MPITVGTKKRTTRRTRGRRTASRVKMSPTALAVDRYIEGVLNGKVIAGQLIRLAVKRHLLDLQKGKKRGLRFDEQKATDAIEFFSYLKHSKGEWAGQSFRLEPWQMFIVWVLFGWVKKDGTRRFRTAYLEVPRKNGKALAVDTPVFTTEGWSRHGDLGPGDFVFGPDGLPKRVMATTSHYVGPCYRVTLSDGCAIDAHARHEWQTRRTWHTGRPHGSRKSIPLLETETIASTLRIGARGDLTHGIAIAQPLQIPEASLPIPPYTLGAWLGDGHSAGARLTCMDEEIVSRIAADGISVKRLARMTYSLGTVGRGGSREQKARSLQGKLSALGVLRNKHLPACYLLAADSQRRALLAGLMDTDGHVTSLGQCEIVLTHKPLFEGVVELLVTLGYKPTQTTDKATIYGRVIGPRYRVQFWARPEDGIVFLPRKAARLRAKTTRRSRCTTRMITDAQPIGDRLVNCIEVEGGFYLAGRSMVTTHNSTIGAGIGLKLAFADDEPGAEVYSAAPLALDTLLPTPSGWTTMGALSVGDFVFDEGGAPTRVTYVSPVLDARECYAVKFHDGETVIADGEHRWLTHSILGQSLSGRSRAEWQRVASRKAGAIRTTREIKETLRTTWGATNHSISAAGPLTLPEALLPIAPYTMGVWLGDGRSNRGSIVLHPNDREVSEYIAADGYRLAWQKSHDGLLHFTVLGLRENLTKGGLIDAKHIPYAFLRGSVLQRIAILQGLMDTDATCTKSGECRFTNRNRDLAEGVHELATSLGLIAHIRAVTVTNRPHYIVSFRAPATIPVFRLKRKYDRQVLKCTPRAGRRFVTQVEPVPSVPVRCIAVESPSHLFLVGRGMIATHNTKKDQAIIVHGEATRMVKASPDLIDVIQVYKNSLTRIDRAQKYEPLGADEDTLDGLNVHAAIVDELHAHKTRGVYDLMETGTSARRQPLLFAITTAGTDQTEASICWEQHVYVEQILRGVIEDDSYFGFICSIDEKDDWQEERNWFKANPNLGVSKKLDYMRDQALKAKNMPSKLNTFLRLDLNKWTQQVTRWIDLGLWDKNAGAPLEETALHGSRCYAGLDLSSVSDLTALVLLFPDPASGIARVLCRFWCPESRLSDENNRYRDQYQTWARAGWLTTTSGNAIDYDVVKAQVLQDAQRFQMQELAVDRLFQGYQMSMQLAEEGLTVAACGMGFMSMAGPTAELERRLLSHSLRHGGNPVLRWMANNVSVKQDPAGNKKPDKSSSQGKIDGIVALLLALDRDMRNQTTASIYETRGLIDVGGKPDADTKTT